MRVDSKAEGRNLHEQNSQRALSLTVRFLSCAEAVAMYELLREASRPMFGYDDFENVCWHREQWELSRKRFIYHRDHCPLCQPQPLLWFYRLRLRFMLKKYCPALFRIIKRSSRRQVFAWKPLPQQVLSRKETATDSGYCLHTEP